MGVVWVVFRGWGVAIKEATSGMALYGILNTLGRFALPVIAFIVLLLTGGLAATAPWAADHLVHQQRRSSSSPPGSCSRSSGRTATADRVAAKAEANRRTGCSGSWVARSARMSTARSTGFRDRLGEIVHRRGLVGAR